MNGVVKALRARRHYKRKGYGRGSLPCLHCSWEHEPNDTETPWQWVTCDKCDWGNE